MLCIQTDQFHQIENLFTALFFIVCDEAVSALDVSIQAQVVNMFEELQEKLGVAYLFIAHDLLVVHHISDRIAVMYLGKMMEIADADELNANPIHPYTLSLLFAVPIPDPETARKSHRIVLEGDVPSPLKIIYMFHPCGKKPYLFQHATI